MKNNIFVLICFPSLILTVFSSKALSYPQVEMQACLSNAINAVAQKGISATYKKVQLYCDCSLRMILDEGRDINSSISYCNKKYIR